jgi:thiol:disulfide interchange protein DsbD
MHLFIKHIPLIVLFGLCGRAAFAQPAPPTQQTSGGINAVLHAAKSGGDQFLQPDEAFRLDATADGTDRVRLNWQIADGYYLYRARIKVATSSTTAQLGTTQMPTGQIKNDEYFGKQEIYHHELSAMVPVARAGAAPLDLPLEVTYQGCAEAGRAGG